MQLKELFYRKRPGAQSLAATEGQDIIEICGLKKVYRVGSGHIYALAGIDLTIARGDFCAVVGTSGSGKSTLLNMLAGLEKPSKGEVRIAGRSLIKMTEDQLVQFRRDNIGFIFQSFNLIPTMTAWENVALPLTFKGVPVSERRRRALKMLKQVGLAAHVEHRPQQMSGGQQQRVGIARALVVEPAIIFADEPTGNLDSKTGAEILQLIKKISKEQQQTLLMVTHDDHLAQYADRIIQISDGAIVDIREGSLK